MGVMGEPSFLTDLKNMANFRSETRPSIYMTCGGKKEKHCSETRKIVNETSRQTVGQYRLLKIVKPKASLF
jgi:hypothetical protein